MVGAPAPRTRARVSCHRWGAASALRLDDIYAIGVHYDEDDAGQGGSLLVRLRPGRVEGVRPVAGHGRGVVVTPEGIYVVDGAGALHFGQNNQWRTIADGVVAVCGDGPVLAITPDRLLRLEQGRVDVVSTRGPLQAVAATAGRIAAADSAGLVIHGPSGNSEEVALPSGQGPVSAIDIAADGELLVGRGGQLLRGNGHGLHVVGEAKGGPLRAVALFNGIGFAGSKVLGLFRQDDEGFRCVRPSLRAHGLQRVNGGLLVVSDLLLSSSDDGMDFVGRDLGSYVRLSEAR